MKSRAGKLSAFIFGLASFSACLFVFSFLSANTSYALSSNHSCNNFGGTCMLRNICGGEDNYKQDNANNANCKRFGNSYVCCTPTDPRTRCEAAGGQVIVASFLSRVNESDLLFPVDSVRNCYKPKIAGCSIVDRGESTTPGCNCVNTFVPTANFNYCGSGLFCRGALVVGSSVVPQSVSVTEEIPNAGDWYVNTRDGTVLVYSNPYTSNNAYLGSTRINTNDLFRYMGICSARPRGTSARNSGLSGNTDNNNKHIGKSCYVKNVGSGTCQNDRAPGSCSNGRFYTGACPGASNIRCCVINPSRTSYRVSGLSGSNSNKKNRPEYPSQDSACVKIYHGKCQYNDPGSCSGGEYLNGKCPGPNNYKCCVKKPNKY